MNMLGQIWLENMLNCSQFADNDSKIWKIQKNVLGMPTVFKCNVHCFKTFFGSLKNLKGAFPVIKNVAQRNKITNTSGVYIKEKL